MDKDTLKGKAKDVAGRAERQAGEWSDDEEMQAEGTKRQVEGKLQKGYGRAKEEGREAMKKAEKYRQDIEEDVEREKRRREAEKKTRKVA